jgi:hypothetical protein
MWISDVLLKPNQRFYQVLLRKIALVSRKISQ